MMLYKAPVVFFLTAAATSGTAAFSVANHRALSLHTNLHHAAAHGRMASRHHPTASTHLFAVDQEQQQQQQNTVQDTDTKTSVERASDVGVDHLKALAQKYRAEAAALEAERAQERAAAAEKAFATFDRDEDGEISLLELKEGLEGQLKTELPQDRIEALMRKFDNSGDGKLQLEEFVGVERFKVALAELARDESRQAIELQRIAQREQQAYDEIAQILNDKPPTNTDKFLSVLPYLLPLLDSLPYASFLVLDNPENPIAQLIASAYFIYRSIPLSGFLAYLSLSFLSGFPRINRLIRFNMLQAISLDIALFIPGAIALLVGGASKLTGQQVPADLVTAASNVLFFVSLVTILYAGTSSLAGQEPDKIPFISKTVQSRLPSLEMLKGWFDEQKSKDDDNDGSKNL